MLPTLHPRRVLQTITPESPRLPPDPNEAFELLYRRYYTPIERYLLHQLGDPSRLPISVMRCSYGSGKTFPAMRIVAFPC